MLVIWGGNMKKHELLVPAGNMECLRYAVLNGCDAVYLACKKFGARKFANNFDNDEIVKAIKFCHLYGVRVYVTMNTLIKNNEVDEFVEQARFLHKNGVDALIVQDFGMICLLREKFPNLEIHASTQANISSSEVCELYKKIGVKRVVFAREIGIDEIDSIDVDIEKEAFIHGALCISYSGCCLMSSMLGGRSGNRGECAGCCRMPFTLEKNNEVISKNKYLLSTKEMCSTYNISRLLDSSIDSFKIEGRMKSPLYVGFITSLYRRLIDGNAIDLKSEMDKLKTIFNRKFTKGRLFYENDIDLMNTISPNHIGLNIGKVIEVDKNKIKIKLDKDYKLNQYDAIRFVDANKGFIVNFLYDSKMNLINSSDNICYVDNKVGLEKLDVVAKTQDYLLNDEVLHNMKRKVEISFDVVARTNSKLCVSISDGVNKFISYGNVVEKSIKAPINEETIKRQLGKLGETPFVCCHFSIDMDDNIFISIKELNDIRRDLVTKLIDIREKTDIEIEEVEVKFNYTKKSNNNLKNTITCFVYNELQLRKCLSLGVDYIYVVNRELYDKYSDNSSIYYVNSRCLFDIDKNIVSKNVISDYINFSKYPNSVFRGNYGLNITNIYTAYYLNKFGINDVMLSVELTEEEIEDFYHLYISKFGYFNCSVFAYGRIENMIIKGNILNIDEGYDCGYQLIDFKNRKFPVYYDGINTHIINYELKKENHRRILNDVSIVLDLFLISESDIEKIVNMYH